MDAVSHRSRLPYHVGETVWIGRRPYIYLRHQWTHEDQWITLAVNRDATEDELRGDVEIEGQRWQVETVEQQ